jgi:Calcineurin-like phosphoesterase
MRISLPAISGVVGTRRGKQRAGALLAPVVALASLYGLFSMASPSRSARLSQEEAELPAFVPDAPFLATRYLDRKRIGNQTLPPPGLIQTVLYPTLGAPARIGEDGRISVVLREPGAAAFLLIPREELNLVDEDLYGGEPLPSGSELMRARLARSRRAHATGEPPSTILTEEERRALAMTSRGSGYGDRQARLLERVQKEDRSQALSAVARVRRKVADRIGSGQRNLYRSLQVEPCKPLTIAESCITRVAFPAQVPPGLYTLAALAPDGSMQDFQMNAVYRPTTGNAARFNFVVAADMQWGTNPAVAIPAMKFISLLNAMAASPDAPEFVLFAGDVVDCEFGSAGSLKSKIFGDAVDYARDYVQAWLVLAALRLPVYIVPGNHDGFRFVDISGNTSSDGLLLFESTLGPTYHSFDRPPYRFVLANSYDLPAWARTSRRSSSSGFIESVSDKLNVLNWGGGIRNNQHLWISRQFGLGEFGPPDESAGQKLQPLFISHHDPRGTYPALKGPRQGIETRWDIERHVPMTISRGQTSTLLLPLAPRFTETEEIHAGYYTPLRQAGSLVRAQQWFEIGLRMEIPLSNGYPGWSRYQQEWHMNSEFAKGFDDIRALDEQADGLTPPLALLQTLVEGGVRAIFKGHDNRFARASMAAGESIFGSHAEAELTSYAPAASRELAGLHLKAPLTVFHTADISDYQSDGHGFLWVEVDASGLEAWEIDHF